MLMADGLLLGSVRKQLLSNSNAVPAGGPADEYRLAWYHRLTICLPLVFLIGTSGLLLTRWIFEAHFPQEFIGDSPSISGTASRSPSGEFFMWTMLSATLCIFISWSLNFTMNVHRLATAHMGNVTIPALLNQMSFLAGIIAGTFLALLAIYDVKSGRDMHMASSWIFYVSQVLAILFDTACALSLARICRLDGRIAAIGRRARLSIGSTLLVSSLLFLYLYLTSDSVPPDQRYTMQLIYVAAEYTVALLCFAYPMAVYWEIRRHFASLRRRRNLP
jgi:hypothetical protein